MQKCKFLTIYYFLATQCKLKMRSKCYFSETLPQNVRLINDFSLYNRPRTAGLLSVMCWQRVLRHNLAKYNLEVNVLSNVSSVILG